MARNTQRRKIWNDCVLAVFRPSVRWPCVNSHSASNHLNVLPAKNRCAGSTKPSSACLHWKANQLTRDCKMSHQPNNIFAGTQVVSLVEVRRPNHSIVHPRG